MSEPIRLILLDFFVGIAYLVGVPVVLSAVVRSVLDFIWFLRGY